MSKYGEIKSFLKIVCPYKSNFCNGQAIKTEKTVDREPCRFYRGGKCRHLLNPKNMRQLQKKTP